MTGSMSAVACFLTIEGRAEAMVAKATVEMVEKRMMNQSSSDGVWERVKNQDFKIEV
jgi:hypothetical protein